MNTITQGLSPKLLAMPALEPIRTMPTWTGKAYNGMYRARPDQASTWAFPRSFEPMSVRDLIG